MEENRLMTEAEMENLAECYIDVEGYTDTRSIYLIMCQEYPGEFDKKQALQVIRRVVRRKIKGRSPDKVRLQP